jgi:hypothetical protein
VSGAKEPLLKEPRGVKGRAKQGQGALETQKRGHPRLHQAARIRGLGICAELSKSVYPTGQDSATDINTGVKHTADYVDWTALDGYNWGTSQSGSTWQTATTIFKPSYDAIVSTSTTTGLAPSKPYMVAETSSAEAGGSKANWITDLYDSAIPNSMPLIRAVVWFSSDKTAQGETDWRVDSLDKNGNTTALTAYQAVATKETAWQGYVP